MLAPHQSGDVAGIWRSSTGDTCPGAEQELYVRVPSKHLQPKFAPRPPPLEARTKSTSSRAVCPTSPIVRSPVERSNENRHGLRSPYAQISPRAPATPTNGLLDGMR